MKLQRNVCYRVKREDECRKTEHERVTIAHRAAQEGQLGSKFLYNLRRFMLCSSSYTIDSFILFVQHAFITHKKYM
jgi:hypothetical protein